MLARARTRALEHAERDGLPVHPEIRDGLYQDFTFQYSYEVSGQPVQACQE
jgi:hypothetical protein